jgi:hypothetical protein
MTNCAIVLRERNHYSESSRLNRRCSPLFERLGDQVELSGGFGESFVKLRIRNFVEFESK